VIPGGHAGLLYSVIAPVLLGALATAGSILSADRFALYWGPAAILLGPLVYLFVRRPASLSSRNVSS